MRGSVVASGIVHGAFVAALLAVRGPVSVIVPGPDVVQVSLLDPTATLQPTPPRPETPPPETKVPDIKPVEDEGVKLQPEKKKPKPEEPKREETPPTPQAPALPSAPLGSSGLRGDVAVDASNFEFTYYLILVRNKIAQNWTPPTGISAGGGAVRAVVYFRITRGGQVGAVRLENSSGVEFFDRTAQRAIVISDPLPPLPLGFGGSELGVHFGFEWAGP
ncbi:MAG TPA: energy transducer TonB [Candidatus Limnocylindria bacterium]|nr:energy transducer TonB [Candidatus Limnocylindria bacterium]